MSLLSFIGQYLSLLNFPADVVGALLSETINLQEAAQLARLSPERLDTTPHGASQLRCEIVQSHTAMKGSQNALRARQRIARRNCECVIHGNDGRRAEG